MSGAAGKRKEKRAKKEKADTPGFAGLWGGGLVCGVILMLTPGSAILVGVLLLPLAGLALAMSRNGGGRTIQASLLFGLASCVHPLHVLWGGDTTPAAAIALLRQPMVVPVGWIALLFGLASCVHPLHVLWGGDTTPAAAIALLRQPMVVPVGWIALLAGWLVSELATAALRIQSDIAAASQRRRMMARIGEIEDEWGPMPAAAPLPPL